MRHPPVSFLFVSSLLLALALLAFDLIRDYHLRIFSGLYGFSRREPFSLLDSLPALSPGLSNLEAYKLTADPASPTNADRSIWLSDSAGKIQAEFYSARADRDSTVLIIGSPASGFARRTLNKKRTIRWTLPLQVRIHDWIEVVGVYVSLPPRPRIMSTDTSARLFERVEGQTLHLVRRRYRDRREALTRPDTVYAIKESGELTLLARGNALAIVNPEPKAVRLKVVHPPGSRAEICEAPSHSVSIYRTILRKGEESVLAYTEPGRTFPVLSRGGQTSRDYFWLDGTRP